jgi:hypothetical protein
MTNGLKRPAREGAHDDARDDLVGASHKLADTIQELCREDA